jgi:pathogenesis-related protein 1
MAVFSHLLLLVAVATAALAAPSSAAFQRRAPSADDQKTYLDLHNTLRAQHHADALTWNQTLSDAAASWAGKCVFEHSGGKLGPYGENLSAGFPLDVKGAVQMWINEERELYFLCVHAKRGAEDRRTAQYNPQDPQYSHYTQMVWKGTTQLGCAEADCKAGTIWADNVNKASPSRRGARLIICTTLQDSKFYVCEYYPPGNYVRSWRRSSRDGHRC